MKRKIIILILTIEGISRFSCLAASPQSPDPWQERRDKAEQLGISFSNLVLFQQWIHFVPNQNHYTASQLTFDFRNRRGKYIKTVITNLSIRLDDEAQSQTLSLDNASMIEGYIFSKERGYRFNLKSNLWDEVKVHDIWLSLALYLYHWEYQNHPLVEPYIIGYSSDMDAARAAKNLKQVTNIQNKITALFNPTNRIVSGGEAPNSKKYIVIPGEQKTVRTYIQSLSDIVLDRVDIFFTNATVSFPPKNKIGKEMLDSHRRGVIVEKPIAGGRLYFYSNKLIIAFTFKGFPVDERGMIKEDEILEVNSKKVTKDNLDEILKEFQESPNLDVIYRRQNQTNQVQLTKKPLRVMIDPTNSQSAELKWIF